MCIDLPGHGKSSHFQKGLALDLMVYVFSIKRVVDHFKWTKIHYLGHSVGGTIGIYFACLFPEHVEKLVAIDIFPPNVIETEDTVKELRILYTKLFEIEIRLRESKPPSYTIDEVVERMLKNRGTEISYEHALSFVKRSLVQVESDRYKFTADQRLKLGLGVFLNGKQIEDILKGARCPMLIVEASRTRLNPMFRIDKTRFYQTCLGKHKNVVFCKVNGDHDVHLIHPERLEPIIKSFFSAQNSHL